MIEIRNLTKTFRGNAGEDGSPETVLAVDNLSIKVEPGEFFTLLGPSGCGKTTTLRCVAGLEYPDSGEIIVNDRVLYSSEQGIRVPASDRGLGMVFQSYAIWPHMNVFDNVGFPLQIEDRSKRRSKAEIKKQVHKVLEVMHLGDLANRPATDLSGGQQQRLALARALVNEPPLLLLDEPLSNLDAKLREEMRFELKRLQRELGITAIYVTHDQVEALTMSSRIAVMNRGIIEQLAKPREIYERPTSQFVADFIGTTNFLSGTVTDVDGDTVTVSTGSGDLFASSVRELHQGQHVRISVRPESIEVEEGSPAVTAPGVWQGVVEARSFMGEAVDHICRVGDQSLRVRGKPSVSIAPKSAVTLTFPVSASFVLPNEVDVDLDEENLGMLVDKATVPD